ncbi:MAG: hypothetical protein ACYTFG_18535, partial [Planctomycetota bacterium]
MTENSTIETENAPPGAAFALGRSRMYRFLASCFLDKPTEELVQGLLSTSLISELGEAYPTEALRRFSENAPSMDALIEESDALFRVPSGRYVTPYESVYLGTQRKDKKDRPGGCLMG